MPTAKANNTLIAVNSSVTGRRSRIAVRTGWPVKVDWPKSPRSRLDTHMAYCMGSGRSNPYFSRNTCACSSFRCTRHPTFTVTIPGDQAHQQKGRRGWRCRTAPESTGPTASKGSEPTSSPLDHRCCYISRAAPKGGSTADTRVSPVDPPSSVTGPSRFPPGKGWSPWGERRTPSRLRSWLPSARSHIKRPWGLPPQ